MAAINYGWLTGYLPGSVQRHDIDTVPMCQFLALPEQATPREDEKMLAIVCPETVRNRLQERVHAGKGA